MSTSTSLGGGIKLLMIATLTSLFTVACGQGGVEQTESGSDATDQSESVTFDLAHVQAVGHPYVECGTEPLVEEVTEGTDGSVRIETFPNAQLGGSNELGQQLVAGNLAMSLVPFPVLAQHYPSIGVLNAAYLFESPEESQKVLDGEIGQELFAGVLEETDVRILGTWYYGARQLTTGDTPVRSPDDLEGLDIRAIDNEIQIANVQSLGANASPVAFEELYLALQQGIVDGQENPLATIDEQRFGEVQSYLMLTNHLFPSQAVAISESAWQQLSDEQQSVLQDAVDASEAAVRDCIIAAEEELLAEWQDTGELEVVEDVDRDAFRERARQMLPEQFEGEWGDLYQRIQDAS